MHFILPKAKIETVKYNFVFQALSIWNALIDKLLNKCLPNSDGIMVPGSVNGSDLSASIIAIIKNKLKDVLLYTQRIDPNF